MNNFKSASVSVQSFSPSQFSDSSQSSRKKSAHLPLLLRQSHPGPVTVQQSLQSANSLNIKRKLLDGFALLNATGMSFPEDGRKAMLINQGYTDVENADMAFFNGLLFLDVSENYLDIKSFGILPRLKELRMVCNFIQEIPDLDGCYPRLQYLDLSYNDISSESLAYLTTLPYLKELDLCGNCLGTLPIEMYQFEYLERLLLEHNKLEDNSVFLMLCAMPSLREVSLAYNFLTEILPESCHDDDCFRLLELMDLSFNYFATEASVTPMLQVLRLDKLILYGNPLLGPTGEDPLGMYIEDLLQAAYDARDGYHPSRALEIVTEMPQKKKKGKHELQGRQ
eukprot:gene12652-26646_t